MRGEGSSSGSGSGPRAAVLFTNLGPYHLARLRALGDRLSASGGRLLAIETADEEGKYPWVADRSGSGDSFDRRTLFEGRRLEGLGGGECRRAVREALEGWGPDAVFAAGYSRPECREAAVWCRGRGVPAILMSETQEIDHRRVWWREALKRRVVRGFDGALAGGPSHRDYLAKLGMPSDRIALGYDAVDNGWYAGASARWRERGRSVAGVPAGGYFLTVCRFAAEKNLDRLIEAYSIYHKRAGNSSAWDLVLCGGGPEGDRLRRRVSGLSGGARGRVHFPGFLHGEELAKWYAFAGAFVLASVSEPWGLVVNEAAACGVPLLVSDRAGASGTLVFEGVSGRRFDPTDVSGMADGLEWMAGLSEGERSALGRGARGLVSEWGPDRFAAGALEAWSLAAGVAIGAATGGGHGDRDLEGTRERGLVREAEVLGR